jgi:hypothetical protein
MFDGVLGRNKKITLAQMVRLLENRNSSNACAVVRTNGNIVDIHNVAL